YFAKYFPYFAKGPEYEKFLIKNDWVRPYALFKVLKDTQIHQNWAKWPKKLQNPTGNYRRELEIHYQKEMDFYILLQFLSFKQLKEVNIHAHRKGVWIKGDIPILISPESSDVWLFREDFDRKYSAGAPP